MSLSSYLIFGLTLIADIAALPLIAWAWNRSLAERSFRRRSSWLSGVSLLLATASALLALGAVLYSGVIGGFPFYDHRLLRIYAYGGLVSGAGLIVGLAGLFFRSSVRWQAPVAGLCTLLFWFGCAATE